MKKLALAVMLTATAFVAVAVANEHLSGYVFRVERGTVVKEELRFRVVQRPAAQFIQELDSVGGWNPPQ